MRSVNATLQKNRLDAVIVLSLALASWVLYRFLGLRFDPSPLNGYFQFIDIVLLQSRLLESLYYYHANPPLLNLLAGLSLQGFGQQHVWFLSAVFHGLGAILALTFMVLVRELTGLRWLALLASALLLFSPDFVLYQNWLMYTFPTAALLTISAFCLLKIVRTESVFWLHAFCICLALIVLTRSLFHLGWFLLVIAIGISLLPGRRKQLLVAALAPVLVCALWYGKNQVVFGQFGASSWLGLGLSNITTLTVPKEKLEPLVQDGTLSPFALRSRYVEENLFVDLGLEPVGIPVLDNVKTTNGSFNFNHRNILVLGAIYRDDGLKVLQHFPEYYMSGVARANRQFFSTNNLSPFFWPQAHAAFDSVRPFYDVVFYGAGLETETLRIPRFGDEAGFNTPSNPGYTTMVLWLSVTAFSLFWFFRGVTGHDANRDFIVVGYIVSVMLYVYGLSTLIELMENYRYRFLVEPIYWVVVILMLSKGASWLKQRVVPAS